jgi:hypothetical protein
LTLVEAALDARFESLEFFAAQKPLGFRVWMESL